MAIKKEPDRLALDSCRALATGMSYGKWKALHPHTDAYEGKAQVEAEAECILAESDKKCKICGKLFSAEGHHRIYCGAECAAEANKIKNRAYQRKKRMEREMGRVS